MVEALASGREAVRRHAWSEAVEALTQAERQEPLTADDLLLLASAAWWDGQVEEAHDALERAFDRYLEAGRRDRAAIVALRLCELGVRRTNFAVGQGWLARAERLLQEEPESVAHAWLAFVHAMLAIIARGDFRAGLEAADRSLELARRHDSPDVESLALTARGQALLRQGRWAEGLANLDEAAAAAVSGRLDPKNACDVYCNTIAACSDLGEYRRAGEWIDEADRWMQRRAIRGYRGECRVHRAGLKRLRGAWAEAEQEARDACQELERFRMLDAIGYAHYEIGEVRLARGDLAGAEEAFERAYAFGRPPQPGLAMLLLARGETEGAARSIENALAGVDGHEFQARDLLQRARLLPARVEIALASGDLATAGAAADELEEIAGRYDSEALRAAALAARGAVLVASGEGEAAAGMLERAWRAWQRLELPLETARARTLLARARLAVGDDATARLELRAAETTLDRLGAVRELTEVRRLLAGLDRARARSVTRTFMFTDIVTSTDFVRMLGDVAWKDLIAWHDRALREEIGHHRGHEVRHTGDGMFVTFEDAGDALRCAVAIQRRLAEHRRTHGFAPWVRIGLHAAQALPHGGDYAGQGVHVAARIGDLAEREQVLASRAALDAAGDHGVRTSHVRTVSLKGVAEPVEVHVVAWE